MGDTSNVPKIVDHEHRRQQLVEAAWRVINRVGIDNMTIREIATECGCSTGSLAHYFGSKDDILRSALERADNEIRERLQLIPGDAHPATALRHVLREALPLDDTRAFELTLDVNFWARALNQPSLRRLQHRDHDAWRGVVMDRVVAAQEAGALDTGRSASDTTDLLLAFVDGLGLQGLIYPELLTRRRIETLVDVQLAALGADPRYLVDLTIGPTPVLTAQAEGAST
ncbi:TetR/AcrR family transcriptional regulator [soil metagenome]|jgi:AcrR family transcriptional regulator